MALNEKQEVNDNIFSSRERKYLERLNSFFGEEITREITEEYRKHRQEGLSLSQAVLKIGFREDDLRSDFQSLLHQRIETGWVDDEEIIFDSA